MPQHAAMIAVLLLERPTCLSCVSSHSRLPTVEIERYLTTIATALVVFRLENERCRVCGKLGGVYSVSPPRTAGAGETIDDDLRPRARLLLDARAIPRIRASDNAEDTPCALLCGRPFVRGRAWYEVRFPSRSFWLDGDCFAIWREELERAKRSSA